MTKDIRITPRQAQTLILLATGNSTKQMAYKMSISELRKDKR